MDEVDKWKGLYTTLKTEFEVFLRREPQSQNSQNLEEEGNNDVMEEQIVQKNRPQQHL